MHRTSINAPPFLLCYSTLQAVHDIFKRLALGFLEGPNRSCGSTC